MARVGYRFQAYPIDTDAGLRSGECSFCVPCRDGCREPGPAILAAVLALPGFHPHVCALRLLLVISLWPGWPLAYKKFRIKLKVFRNQPFVMDKYLF